MPTLSFCRRSPLPARLFLTCCAALLLTACGDGTGDASVVEQASVPEKAPSWDSPEDLARHVVECLRLGDSEGFVAGCIGRDGLVAAMEGNCAPVGEFRKVEAELAKLGEEDPYLRRAQNGFKLVERRLAWECAALEECRFDSRDRRKGIRGARLTMAIRTSDRIQMVTLDLVVETPDGWKVLYEGGIVPGESIEFATWNDQAARNALELIQSRPERAGETGTSVYLVNPEGILRLKDTAYSGGNAPPAGAGGTPGQAGEFLHGSLERRERCVRRARELLQRRHFLEESLASRVFWSAKLAWLRDNLADVAGGPDGQAGLSGIRLKVDSSTGNAALDISGWCSGTSDGLGQVIADHLRQKEIGGGFAYLSPIAFEQTPGKWRLELETRPRPAEESVPWYEDLNLSPELAVIALEKVLVRDRRVVHDSSEVGRFISVIGECEKGAGVVVTRLQGLSSRGRSSNRRGLPSGVTLVPLSIEMGGTFDQFIRFVSLLENREPLVRITGFDVERASGAESLEIRIDLEILYVVDEMRMSWTGTDAPQREILSCRPEVQAAVARFKPLKLERCELAPAQSARDLFRDPSGEATPPGPDSETEQPAPASDAGALVEAVEIEGLTIEPRRGGYAIISGRILSEGDYVDPEKRILIKSIRKDAIDFVCDGRIFTREIVQTTSEK